MYLLQLFTIMLYMFSSVADVSNITIEVFHSTATQDTNSIIILFLHNVDLSCGGVITNIEITASQHNDNISTWKTFTDFIPPNQYHFMEDNPATSFILPISARITRSLHSIHNTLTAPNVITSLSSASNIFNFGTNLCVELYPFVWYSHPELNVSYLYHSQCILFNQRATEHLCQNTYNGDGVASIPTSKHWKFIQSMVTTKPKHSCSMDEYNQPFVSIGAQIINTSCTQYQKQTLYQYWNGDTYNDSVFEWMPGHPNTDCSTQRGLHFMWDSKLMTEAAMDVRHFAVICYKNIYAAEPTSTYYTTSHESDLLSSHVSDSDSESNKNKGIVTVLQTLWMQWTVIIVISFGGCLFIVCLCIGSVILRGARGKKSKQRVPDLPMDELTDEDEFEQQLQRGQKSVHEYALRSISVHQETFSNQDEKKETEITELAVLKTPERMESSGYRRHDVCTECGEVNIGSMFIEGQCWKCYEEQRPVIAHQKSVDTEFELLKEQKSGCCAMCGAAIQSTTDETDRGTMFCKECVASASTNVQTVALVE